jgi:hypothetical protein
MPASMANGSVTTPSICRRLQSPRVPIIVGNGGGDVAIAAVMPTRSALTD